MHSFQVVPWLRPDFISRHPPLRAQHLHPDVFFLQTQQDLSLSLRSFNKLFCSLCQLLPCPYFQLSGGEVLLPQFSPVSHCSLCFLGQSAWQWGSHFPFEFQVCPQNWVGAQSMLTLCLESAHSRCFISICWMCERTECHSLSSSVLLYLMLWLYPSPFLLFPNHG